MATTANGFWYPDGTEPYNIKILLATAAASQDAALVAAQNILKLRNGHQNFASTGARDSAYTAAGGPQAGDQCTVLGQPQWYDGTNWLTGFRLEAYAGLTRIAATTVNVGTAYVIVWTATQGANKNVTTSLTATGMTIQQAGRYQISVYGGFSGTPASGTPTNYNLAPTINGSSPDGALQTRVVGNSTLLSISVLRDLAVGDTVTATAQALGGTGAGSLTRALLHIDKMNG